MFLIVWMEQLILLVSVRECFPLLPAHVLNVVGNHIPVPFYWLGSSEDIINWSASPTIRDHIEVSRVSDGWLTSPVSRILVWMGAGSVANWDLLLIRHGKSSSHTEILWEYNVTIILWNCANFPDFWQLFIKEEVKQLHNILVPWGFVS